MPPTFAIFYFNTALAAGFANVEEAIEAAIAMAAPGSPSPKVVRGQLHVGVRWPAVDGWAEQVVQIRRHPEKRTKA